MSNFKKKLYSGIMWTFVCLAVVFTASAAGANTGILNTKHNLSVSGPGPYKATIEDRICVFCHTPHNASPQTPLWNKKIEAVNYDAYTPYTSSTMVSAPARPTGPSRLCLSCHDGTLALGEVRLPSAKISMTITGGIPSSSPSYFGTSLANHHPISFSYSTSLANPEISPVPPANLLLYGNDVIQCTTCHDPHDNTNKKFLAVSNENSGLCVLCHTMYGWSGSSHATSLNTWNLVSPNPWPRTWSSGFWDFGWTTVKQNGCENCHAPHAAGSTSRLLNEEAEEQNCYPCHNGHVASKNIQDQFIKASRHRVDAYMGTHDPKESLPILTAHVECVDCHNPHASNSATTAPPFVSGKLQKVSGIDRNGVRILPPDFAQYEYEICFKCHGDSSSLFPFIERYINTSNTRVEFNPNNASYHPVIDMGKASISGVPSLNPASTDPEAPQGLNASSFIACTDCHSDEVVNNNVLMSRGPHGSPYAPILRRQYLTTVGIPEGLQSYGLCYRCHNRTSILSDVSFGKNSVGKGGHSGHLNTIGSTQVDASCSVCHDPHGVPDTGAGSHTHLINFDKRYVNDTPAPVYTDLGSHSGSCTLVCHDAAGNAVIHNGSSTFSYGGGGAIQIQF